MKDAEHYRRVCLMHTARAKWGDRRIGVVERDGVVEIKAISGRVVSETVENGVIVVRSEQVVYWRGATIEEAERAVGIG